MTLECSLAPVYPEARILQRGQHIHRAPVDVGVVRDLVRAEAKRDGGLRTTVDAAGFGDNHALY